MATLKVPEQIKESIEKIVNEFNATKLKKFNCKFEIQYKGNFLYLLLDEGLPDLSPTLRLKYTGNLEKWEFAIFKWSSETYTTDYLFIPGSEYIDGSIAGALQAAIIAYPPRSKNDSKNEIDFLNSFLKLMGK